jgi:hypothetical protein
VSELPEAVGGENYFLKDALRGWFVRGADGFLKRVAGDAWPGVSSCDALKGLLGATGGHGMPCP